MTASTLADLYPTTFVVAEIDNENDLVSLVDYNGNEWLWEGAEDLEVFDVVAAIMNDGETSSIYDDEIVEIRYCGRADAEW